MAKQPQCPSCAFNVTAESEGEVLKHVMVHKVDHPEKDVSEDGIRRRMRCVEVRQARA